MTDCVMPVPIESAAILEDAPTADGTLIIERNQPLSRSLLWRLQRAYFERVGVDAWRTGQVPHYITSNPFMAAAYARVITGFLRDLVAAESQPCDEPLTIIELGAGSGRFAYHFLQKLLAEPLVPVLRGTPIRYVMTDVSPANLTFWREHPQLRPHFEAGVLDVAIFDAGRDESLHLEIAGITLTPSCARRPLVVIANYVFDGLPQDAWLLSAGILHEGRVTLTSPASADDPADPTLLQRLDVTFEHTPLQGAPEIAPDQAFLVGEYQLALGDGAFQLPTATLRCIGALSRLSSGGFLLLSADKGYCREEELLYRSNPEIVRHGSISLAVDYHAVGRYVESLGGAALFPAYSSPSLVVGAFLIDAPAGGVETRAAFASAVDGFGPGDWFTLKKGLEAACAAVDLSHLLASIRLGGFDAKLFMDVSERLLDLSSGASGSERRACFTLARRIWELHYEIGESRDLAFHLGLWMRELGYLEEAIRYFELSRASHGVTALTAYNLAFCHLGQQRAMQALQFVEEAIGMDPALTEARALRTEIRAILRDEAA